MVRKLISSLTAKTGWRLLVKTAIGFLALLLAGLLEFHFLGVLLFLAVSAWIYFTETTLRTARRSYFALLALWAWGAGAATFGLAFYLVAVVYAVLLYSWLGDVRLLWADRPVIAGVGEAGLFAALAATTFYLFPGPTTASFWGDLGFLVANFAFSAVLVREAFRFETGHFPRRERLAAWAGGLILAEVAAVVVFLPLGYLNAAAVLTLIFIVLRDILLAHFRGHLKIGLVFREITILVVFLVLIFSIVPWVLG